MADFNILVAKCALTPATIYAGSEGAVGKTIGFTFSDDWDGFTKEVIFYDMRGNAIMVPCVGDSEVVVTIPAELSMYGGAHKFTVRGFTLDENDYIDESIQITGTIFTTYTAGHNPRMEGKILPSTLDLFLAQASEAMRNWLQNAKDSGEFDGDPAGFGDITVNTVTLDAGSPASVKVTASGENTAKNFSFVFQIPAGDSGVWVSDDITDPPSADQNLWVLTEGGDNYLYIPDGLSEEGGKVYLTADGEKFGDGASIVGKNFTILGHYTTLAALQSAVPHPEIGDAYGIGTITPYHAYLWNGTAWEDYGTIGSGSVVDTAMSGTSANAVQNKVIKAYVDGLIGDVNSAITAINSIVGA